MQSTLTHEKAIELLEEAGASQGLLLKVHALYGDIETVKKSMREKALCSTVPEALRIDQEFNVFTAKERVERARSLFMTELENNRPFAALDVARGFGLSEEAVVAARSYGEMLLAEKDCDLEPAFRIAHGELADDKEFVSRLHQTVYKRYIGWGDLGYLRVIADSPYLAEEQRQLIGFLLENQKSL